MTIWVDANGWPVPPLLLLGCLIAETLYFRGWCVLVKKALVRSTNARAMSSSVLIGSVSGEYQWNAWLWRGIFFLGAILAFLVAASTLVDTLSGRFFWVHMIQHLLLLVIMAPLLVASAPLLPLWLGLPIWARRLLRTSVSLNVRRGFISVVHWLRQPAVSCVLLIVGTWTWHWPALYDFALTNDFIHDWGEHTSFLLVSVLFWSQVIPCVPLHPRTGYIGQMGCIGVAIVQNIIFAAVIGFAQVPLYAPYIHLVQWPGGISALQDQQIGAGIMWTFGDLPYGIAFSVLLQRWLASISDDTDFAVTKLSGVER
jgi:cytochrome c oxidase assembly factor CtaG